MLPEAEPISTIIGFFGELGYDVEVHAEPPARPDPRTVSRELRDVPSFSHWCGLNRGGQTVARWYGGGWSEEEAIRSARRRWRIEQEGAEPGPRQLP